MQFDDPIKQQKASERAQKSADKARKEQEAIDRAKKAIDLSKGLLTPTENYKRVLFPATGPGVKRGIIAPLHMWEGYAAPKGKHIDGMREINKARAEVYGGENRDPLSIKEVEKLHKSILADHFKKPINEQMIAEQNALERLRAARHIGENANTLDESEKTDTAQYEPDPYYAWTSKGVAGHAIYTSGTGENMKMHALNTCPSQTEGCAGGIKDGIVNTINGGCFAPQAENQYGGAAVRRAAHEQAKHDPAMTRDWILAHTGSLRGAASQSDKLGRKTLFRPNVVDESDLSSRHVIAGLNAQRVAAKLPKIISNSYGKGEEINDPENGEYKTYSNTGPKVKFGATVSENVKRDNRRVRRTITAKDKAENDERNEQGNLTPPLNSYLVTDVDRYSPLDQRMQNSVKTIKYWTRGRPYVTPEEEAQGPEGHFALDENGRIVPTTPENAHFGHTTINNRRYDYQKHHVIPPREVEVPVTKNGVTSIEKMHTDSRFKDDLFYPPADQRYRTPNNKIAGGILMTTPTTSTKGARRLTGFYHHFNDEHVQKALANNGEHEIDSPYEQEAARGNEYVAPQEPAKTRAFGGAVGNRDFCASENMGLPEQNSAAQDHLMHGKLEFEPYEKDSHRAVIDKAMNLISKMGIH